MTQLTYDIPAGTSAASAHRELRRVFTGPIYLPGDDEYDAARAVVNPTVDARPLLIAEAGGRRDVRAAIGWAGNHGVPIAVQSTGHGTHVAADRGLLLKTSRLATVLVDPDRRVARVGAGARWRDVLAAAEGRSGDGRNSGGLPSYPRSSFRGSRREKPPRAGHPPQHDRATAREPRRIKRRFGPDR